MARKTVDKNVVDKNKVIKKYIYHFRSVWCGEILTLKGAKIWLTWNRVGTMWAFIRNFIFKHFSFSIYIVKAPST